MDDFTHNELTTHALKSFFKSPGGSALLGNIVRSAINDCLTRDIEVEDGKTDPGRRVIREKRVNVIDQLARYLPHVEAAVRGCQADVDKARDLSAQTRNILANAIIALGRISGGHEPNIVLNDLAKSCHNILMIEDKKNEKNKV